MLLLDEPAVVLKRELADIPLWGWVVRRYGVIPVDRAGGAAALRRMMRAARGGDRRGPADRDLPGRHARAAGRAAAAPAGLRRPLPRARSCRSCRSRSTAAGSGRAHRFVKRPGIVTFRFGEPIPPGLPRDEIEAAVHAAINALDEARDARARPDRGLFRPSLELGRAARGGPLPRAARLSLLPLRAQGRRLSAPALAGALSRRPSWRRSPRFAEICRAAGVRFGIGLSPFELHLHPDDGWQDGARRASSPSSTQLGPDDLAILFDDMRGDVPDLAERQAAIVAFRRRAQRRRRGSSAARLIIPTIRSSTSPSAPRPPFYLEQLGRLLDPAIEIMWTGEEVCSREFSPGHLARVADQIGRKPFLWDNYPVNDGAAHVAAPAPARLHRPAGGDRPPHRRRTASTRPRSRC